MFMRFMFAGFVLFLAGCTQSVCRLVPYTEHGLYGFLDANGKRVTPPSFEQIGAFSEGLCAVKLPGTPAIGTGGPRDGLWGYLDCSGNYAIRPNYLEAKEFQGGTASVLLLTIGDNPNLHAEKKHFLVIDRFGRIIKPNE